MPKLVKNKSNLLTRTKQQPAKLSELKSFLRMADANLINAMRRLCRNTFPLTVKAFSGLSAGEIANGLPRLPQVKLDALLGAMREDKFICFTDKPNGRKPKKETEKGNRKWQLKKQKQA